METVAGCERKVGEGPGNDVWIHCASLKLGQLLQSSQTYNCTGSNIALFQSTPLYLPQLHIETTKVGSKTRE